MAKSNKQPQKPISRTPAAAPAAPPKIVKDFLLRGEHSGASDPLLRKIFYGLAGLLLAVMVALSFGSGINADDKFQNDYSLKLVNYYGTMGKDTSALFVKDGNMHLYGGLFEVATGFANKAAGLTPNDLAYHHVRHVASAIFGWLAILFSALLARHIAGWRAGMITLVIMAVSPRFIGDSLMNPKDIPFACGYIMALYFTARVMDNLPKPNKWDMVGLAGGLAIGLAMRAGGLLSFAYLIMFAGLHFLLKNGGLRALGNMKTLGKYLLYTVAIAAAGYIVAVLFWPYALQNPFKNPFTALSQFSALEVKIRVLFDGDNIMSDKTPWNYPIKWILYTIPLAAIAGFVGAVALTSRLMRRYNPLWVAMVLFAAIFPVFYIIYKDSVIHDGWRHLTFAYPPMAIAAGLFWNELAAWFQEKKAIQYAIYGVLGLLLVDAAGFIAMNPKMPYVYFNPIKGGTQSAFGAYETDYWGVSVRQGLEWMEQQGIIGPNMNEPIIIATNMFYSAQKLTAKYGDKVKIKYLKWERRCDDAWDYAIYPTRFIDGAALQRGFWPPDNAVHIVKAGGAPILAVLKDNGKNCVLGLSLLKVGDYNGAIDKFRAEIQNAPDNELAWANLSQAYLNAGQDAAQVDRAVADSLLNLAKSCAEKALEISPHDSQSNNQIGLYWIEKNDIAKAKEQFELSARLEPSSPGAYYYLALIARSQNDGQAAMMNVMNAIKASPTFKPAYELGAQIAEQTGNASQAQQFRAALQKLK